MKKQRIIVRWVLVIIGLFSVTSLFAQSWNDFYNFGQNLLYDALIDANRIKYTIVNSTGKSVQEIYISPSSNDNWGNNQWQSQELLQTGYQVEAKSDDVGPYDIKVVDTNGISYVKSSVRITSDLVVTFTQNDKEKKGILEKLGNALDYLLK